VLDNKESVGSIILNCFVDGEKIYASVDVCDGEGNTKSTIDEYGIDFTKERSINIDDVSEYIRRSRPNEIAIFGDYIYMRNYSDDGLIGKIENNSVKSLIQERGLEVALNRADDQTRDKQLFYIRRSCNYFVLDIPSGTLSEKVFDTIENFSRLFVLANSDNVLVVLRADNDKLDRYVFTALDRLQ
jgi:hypothetical protein